MTTFDLQHAAMAVLHATAAEKHVLLILALRADKTTSQCRPGIARMVKDSGLSERTVQRAIVSLEAAGHLTRIEKPGVGVIYTVHPRQSVG